MKRILNLEDLHVGEYVIIGGFSRNQVPQSFCKVKVMEKITDPKNQVAFLYKSKLKKLKIQNYTRIKMIEFNEKNSEWEVTIPDKTENKFTSLNDSDFNLVIHKCDYAEIVRIIRNKKRRDTRRLKKKYLEHEFEISKKYSDVFTALQNDLKTKKKETVYSD